MGTVQGLILNIKYPLPKTAQVICLPELVNSAEMNEEKVNGFLATLFSPRPPRQQPGVYSSPSLLVIQRSACAGMRLLMLPNLDVSVVYFCSLSWLGSTGSGASQNQCFTQVIVCL